MAKAMISIPDEDLALKVLDLTYHEAGDTFHAVIKAGGMLPSRYLETLSAA